MKGRRDEETKRRRDGETERRRDEETKGRREISKIYSRKILQFMVEGNKKGPTAIAVGPFVLYLVKLPT